MSFRTSLFPNGSANGSVIRDTTYKSLIESKAIFKGLKPPRRFDPVFKRADNIDWM